MYKTGRAGPYANVWLVGAQQGRTAKQREEEEEENKNKKIGRVGLGLGPSFQPQIQEKHGDVGGGGGGGRTLLLLLLR
jgi:hypothetical protein